MSRSFLCTRPTLMSVNAPDTKSTNLCVASFTKRDYALCDYIYLAFHICFFPHIHPYAHMGSTLCCRRVYVCSLCVEGFIFRSAGTQMPVCVLHLLAIHIHCVSIMCLCKCYGACAWLPPGTMCFSKCQHPYVFPHALIFFHGTQHLLV